MRRSWFRYLAGVSLLAALAPAAAPSRPRYGGTLRMAVSAVLRDLDPAVPPSGPDVSAAKGGILPLVFESLVRIGDDGNVEPLLASSWRHDAQFLRWQFRLRSGVKFQDGTGLTPDLAAAGFSAPPEWHVSVEENGIAIETGQPDPDLLFDLALPACAVVLRGADGSLSGTGPFRLAEWEPGRRARFAANEEHWGGRPFLDGIELAMGRAHRDQLIDLELDRVDLIELPPQEARRASTRPIVVWSSAPLELIALAFDGGRASRIDLATRKALARSIDRASIHSVLLQKRGEPADSLLPGWLSGYAFLFPPHEPQEAAASRPAPGALLLTFDPGDTVLKAIADRIALDARAAGLSIRTAGPGAAPPAAPDLRLVRVRIEPGAPVRALAGTLASLGIRDVSMPPPGDGPEAAFEIERALIEECAVIPLLHLPDVYAVSRKVRVWDTPGVLRAGGLRLEDVWLIADAP